MLLPYLSQAVTATISVIRLYIDNRFKEYEMMSSTLRPLSKNKEPKTPYMTNAKILAGAATTAAGAGADRTSGQGGQVGGGGRGGGSGQGGKIGRRKWPDTGRTGNVNTDAHRERKEVVEFALSL